jgi:hypothetical protein
VGWTDGDDPYATPPPPLDPHGRYAISDSAWAMHVLGLQAALPESSYQVDDPALPMLRAVKDADEISRLAVAGVAGDAALENRARRSGAGTGTTSRSCGSTRLPTSGRPRAGTRASTPTTRPLLDWLGCRRRPS